MSTKASRPDQRRHKRIKARLFGRYMLADGREAKCRLIDISIGGVALAAPERGALGESVVLYVDQIGRLEGTIVRHLDGGFALALEASPRARARLSERLDEVTLDGNVAVAPERRKEPRFPLARPSPTVAEPATPAAPSGFDILDISIFGADLKLIGTDPRPAVGTIIQVGKATGRVVRHTEDGVSIEFTGANETTLAGRLTTIR